MTREEYINKRLDIDDDPSQKLATEIATIKYLLIKANIINSEDFEKTQKIIREKSIRKSVTEMSDKEFEENVKQYEIFNSDIAKKLFGGLFK